MNYRQLKAQQTKKKILSMALELFNDKGFSNVTVDEIIEKTGTSKGAFYNHFKSKHDIFLEEFKEVDSFYVSEILPKLSTIESAKDKLTHFIFMQMEYIEKDLGWDVIRTIYEHELNTETQSFFLNPDRPLYRILFSICQEGQKNGEFREDLKLEQMVTILARVTRGILYDWGINKGNYSLKDEQDSLFNVVIKGLLK